MLDSESMIQEYLFFGYVPSPQGSDRADRAWMAARPPADRSLTEMVKEGVAVLRRVFADLSARYAAGARNVVPLSGGMDSRAILGGLLENVDRSCIHTVTFGVPGAWDFEIGASVARHAGVDNAQMDLSVTPWHVDAMVQLARRCRRPISLFEAYLFDQIRSHLCEKSVYWSGFMGDPLAGSHLLKQDSTTWEQAKRRFTERNRFARSMVLTPPGFDPTSRLPSAPLGERELLCYDEQLDFAVRQECYIQPLVVRKDCRCCTPFLHPEWVGFILSVPRRYRRGQYLYQEILRTAYPRLFSLPAKNSYGLPLTAPGWKRNLRRQALRARVAAKRLLPWIEWGTSPSINYIDFDRGLRERPDLKAVVHESILDLKKRRIVDWIDVDAIWDRHQKRRGNHADALVVLASLEICLKSQERRTPE